MSDAIVLDVADATPVRLDVGDADPIAREEIAALAGRVTTVEGDVSGLSTRMGAVEGDVTALDGRMDAAEGAISTLGTTVDGIDARVESIEADYVTSEDVMGALGGEAPALVSGSSRAMLGDAETASWMERTTAADGAALIEAVRGRTLRWNQLYNALTFTYNATSGAYGIVADGTGKWTVTVNESSTSGDGGNISAASIASRTMTAGHKYLITTKNANITLFLKAYNTQANTIFTAAEARFSNVALIFSNLAAGTYVLYPQLFDLTAMFGAGNEPSTVAEFEALFPEPYYPYDPGSLLPVRMEGVETVAADESWSSQRTIPAATYFPNGMRSAGAVYDELRADESITRVGVVDLGTLTWNNPATGVFSVAVSDMATSVAYKVTSASYAYATNNFNWASVDSYADKSISTAGNNYVYVKDTSYDSAAAFKAAMSGVMLHYVLATPTITPIDPPLPMSYRVGAGGTERVMVASDTTSAPPIFVTRYPLDPADLAASIAPVDGPIAKTNHQVGDLLMLGFTLCKATQVIVTGETIAIGTNVTKTTVAAELAALSQ